jgi:CRISPR system Cascade subunit CasB
LIDTYRTVSKPLRTVGIEYNPEKSWDKGRIWIFIAGLFAHYPQPVEQPHKGNFGNSCWLLQQDIHRQSPDAKGVERRFHTLLDTAFENVQSPVATLLRQMKSKHVAVNYPRLLTDLHWWDGIDKRVQDKWARDFWRVPSSSSEPSESPPDADAE